MRRLMTLSVKIGQHSPQKTFKIVLINKPLWAGLIISFLGAIMSASEKKKILSFGPKGTLAGLEQFIDRDQIPAEVGGGSAVPLGSSPLEIGVFQQAAATNRQAHNGDANVGFTPVMEQYKSAALGFLPADALLPPGFPTSSSSSSSSSTALSSSVHVEMPTIEETSSNGDPPQMMTVTPGGGIAGSGTPRASERIITPGYVAPTARGVLSEGAGSTDGDSNSEVTSQYTDGNGNGSSEAGGTIGGDDEKEGKKKKKKKKSYRSSASAFARLLTPTPTRKKRGDTKEAAM